MGSAEELGSAGVGVGDVRWHAAPEVKKNSIHAVNVSAPGFWQKIPDSEVRVQVRHPSNLHSDAVLNDGVSGNMTFHSPTLDLDSKPAPQRTGKIVRKHSGCTKRSEMAHLEVSKNKSGLHNVNGTFPEIPSSSASYNVSGLRGSQSDVFDIKKYVDEPSLDDLLCGSYKCPFIKDKEKTTTNSNTNILQSVRSACSILQARKPLQARNCADTDSSFIRKDSIGAAGQTDGSRGDSCLAYLPMSEKVHKSDDKIKIHDSPLYTPKDILDRLTLPPRKDLDELLYDASKPSSSKNIMDIRLGKQPISQRISLPPFSWSHSFSGHHKLGSDAVKLCTSRAICQGRWVKVETCKKALQKDYGDLLKDFESLTFDQSSVPSTSERFENKFVPIEGALSASGASSPPKVSADEYSTIHAAAQTLVDMASYSNKTPRALVKLLKKPSQMAMKSSKSKATHHSEISFQAPKSTIRPHNPSKARDDGLSSKKLKISPAHVTSPPPYMTEPTRKPTLDPSSLLVKSLPPRKLLRDPNANTNNYGTNFVKKQCVIRTPRSADRPDSNSGKPNFWRSSQ